MIVCSCNVISDHQVRSVTAERTVRATSEVYRCLGCSAECGRCARTIRRIMDEALAEPASPQTCACASPERPIAHLSAQAEEGRKEDLGNAISAATGPGTWRVVAP